MKKLPLAVSLPMAGIGRVHASNDFYWDHGMSWSDSFIVALGFLLILWLLFYVGYLKHKVEGKSNWLYIFLLPAVVGSISLVFSVFDKIFSG